MNWDAGLLIYIQEHLRSDLLTPFMTFITHTGDSGFIWIIVCILLVIIPRTRRIGIIAGSSIALVALITNVFIKNIVARTRPYEAVEGLVNLIEKQKDYSFPSGHTGASFAVAGALIIIAILGLPIVAESGRLSKTKMTLAYNLCAVTALIYALIIAYSRLYVGVHYPTDVLGGLILGIVTSIAAYFIYRIAIKKISERKAVKTENTTNTNK